MKKSIALVPLILICVAFIALTGNDLIYWSADRKLEWKDFKGTADRNLPELAVTDYSISYTLHAFNDGLRITVKNTFNQQSSWTKDTTDKFLLSHERGHFNLAEVFARKMRKALTVVKFTYDSASSQFNKIYADCYDKLNKEQDAYDLVTDYSRNHISQQLWTVRIDSMLHSLDAYKDTVLQVKIN